MTRYKTMSSNVTWFEMPEQEEKITSPGDTIRSLLNDKSLKWTTAMFAERMKITPADAFDLLEGNLPLTEEIAQKLDDCLNVPAAFWLAEEKVYRDKLAARRAGFRS